MKNLLFILVVCFCFGCGCPEPDRDEVEMEFHSLHPEANLLSVKNTENSPPCFYWDIEYIENNDTILENWRYCCSDIFDSERVLRTKNHKDYDFDTGVGVEFP